MHFNRLAVRSALIHAQHGAGWHVVQSGVRWTSTSRVAKETPVSRVVVFSQRRRGVNIVTRYQEMTGLFS